MKFGQLINRNRNIATEIFFFKNHTENEAGKLVPDLLLFYTNTLYEVNASCLLLSFDIFDIPQLCIK